MANHIVHNSQSETSDNDSKRGQDNKMHDPNASRSEEESCPNTNCDSIASSTYAKKNVFSIQYILGLDKQLPCKTEHEERHIIRPQPMLPFDASFISGKCAVGNHNYRQSQ